MMSQLPLYHLGCAGNARDLLVSLQHGRRVAAGSMVTCPRCRRHWLVLDQEGISSSVHSPDLRNVGDLALGCADVSAV